MRKRLWIAKSVLSLAVLCMPCMSLSAGEVRVREVGDPTVLASPYRIDRKALRGRIRYELQRVDGQPLELPSSAEQRSVSARDRLKVEVCADCRDAPQVMASMPMSADASASPWLSLRDAQVRRLAKASGVSRRDAHRTMRDLTERVRGHFRDTGPSDEFLDAGRALRSQRGDCNEYARLLAALGRVRGIPTRVAIGLVYRPSHRGKVAVFVAHSWVQAWIDGAWHSYDAALGSFGAGHLLLAVSDGDPNAELGLLQEVGQIRIVKAAKIESR